MMKVSLFTFLTLAAAPISSAFTSVGLPTTQLSQQQQQQKSLYSLVALKESKDAAAENSATDTSPRVDPDTHEELMYALGVNLARQLGDVRPLVENGEELAEVAKGLLDTVVGRLPEEGQTQLLARRGEELNELITTRANNIREKLEQAGKEMLAQMKETDGAEELPSGYVLLEHIFCVD